MSEGASERFLAMEYYLAILNRSFEVTITPSCLCGAFVRGIIAATSPSVLAARAANDATKLADPKRLVQARSHEPGSASYLALHRFNFSFPREALAAIRFDPRPKRGMGPVPHSGKLLLELRVGGTRELILLGQQDGSAILSAARALGYPATAA